MRTYLTRLLAGTIVAGTLAAPAFAESGSINAQATLVEVLGINEIAPINFGLFQSFSPGDNCHMEANGGGAISCGASASLNSASVGVLQITGSPNAPVSVELMKDGTTAGGELRVSNLKCDSAGNPGSLTCTVGAGWTDTLDGTGELLVNVGGTLTVDIVPVTPGVFTIVVPVEVNYL